MPKINFAIICDDSRREDNGKLIFIGVYASSILLAHFPAVITLSLVTWMEAAEPIKASAVLQVLLDGKKITEGTAEINMDAGSHISVFPGIPLMIPQAGELEFKLKIADREWQTVMKLPAIPNPSAATASAQPASQSPAAAPPSSSRP